MIARLWRGWKPGPANADAYQSIVSSDVLPSIAARGIAGYHGAYLLRPGLDNEVEFAMTMHFESLDAVLAFAGANMAGLLLGASFYSFFSVGTLYMQEV